MVLFAGACVIISLWAGGMFYLQIWFTRLRIRAD